MFISNNPVRDAEDYYDYCEKHQVKEIPKCPICDGQVEHFGDNCEVCASIIDAALSIAINSLQRMLDVNYERAVDILCDRISEM